MPRQNFRPIDPLLAKQLDQLSSTEKEMILKYATMRTRIMAKAGVSVADDEPSILMHEAIADTMTAVVTWDRVLHKKLVQHLCNVVHSRTSNEIKKARKRSSTSLDLAGDDALPVDGDLAPPRPDVAVERVQLVRMLYAFARERARSLGDAHVLSIVDTYEQHIFKRREVMAATRLRLGEFVNARRRLNRILAAAPEDLRPNDAPPEAVAACCRSFPRIALGRPAPATIEAQAPRRSPRTRGASPTSTCASRFDARQRLAHELTAVLRNADDSDPERERHAEGSP